LQEGFGLTETMRKRMAALVTHACGIRLQIRDGIDDVVKASQLFAASGCAMSTLTLAVRREPNAFLYSRSPSSSA